MSQRKPAAKAAFDFGRKDAMKLGAAAAFSVVTLFGVWLNDEKQRERRHSSIAKDIEREQWRARQIAEAEGRPVEQLDDGFADKFMSDPANAKDVAQAKVDIADMVAGKPATPKKAWWSLF
jgi:leucyl aminopeptidase (aminopeptidase T)